MEKLISKVISALFHPLLIPTYSLLILLWSNFPYGYYLPLSIKTLLLKTIFIGTFGFPVIAIFVLYYRKTITSFSLKNRDERFLPYIACIIFFGMVTTFLQKTNLPAEIKLVPLVSLILIISIFVINLKFKISAHTSGIASLTAFLICLTIHYNLNLLFLVLTTVILSGLVCYSRIEMQAHTPKEAYSGYLLGFTLTVGTYLIVA